MRVWFLLGFAVSAFCGKTPLLAWKIADSSSHPPSRFTQGLFWRDGELWECTGLVGQSAVYRSRGGLTLDSFKIVPPHFGEGCVDYRGMLLVLTWRSRLGFVLDIGSLRPLGTFPIRGEGWGITRLGDTLWMSNGSQYLYRLDPGRFVPVDSIAVRDQDRAITRLNELEGVNGRILANVWLSDSVAVIDPHSGTVEGWLDFSDLQRRSCATRKTNCDVLNGLAWDGQYLWVTGKLWPELWKIQVNFPAKTSDIPRRQIRTNPK